jgi:hypothetical protein
VYDTGEEDSREEGDHPRQVAQGQGARKEPRREEVAGGQGSAQGQGGEGYAQEGYAGACSTTLFELNILPHTQLSHRYTCTNAQAKKTPVKKSPVKKPAAAKKAAKSPAKKPAAAKKAKTTK